MSSDLEDFTSEEIKNCPREIIVKYFLEKYDEEKASLLLERIYENYSSYPMFEDISLSSIEAVVSFIESSEITNMEICSFLMDN
jgi:hypothetical protein